MPLRAQVQLVHQLLQLQRERATGALVVTATDSSTTVYFQAGRAIFADSPAVSQTLGRLLLETGVITHQQYTMAIGELRRLAATDRNARLGGILVSQGFASVEDVQEALFAQMGRRIASLIQLEEPRWTMTAGDQAIAQVPCYPMRVEPLVFDGVRLFFDRARMTEALAPYRGGFLVLRAPVELIVRCFSLRPDHAAVVASIDGTELTESWLMQQISEDAWPLATALAITGVLNVVRAAPTQESVRLEAKKNPSLAPPGNTGVFEVPKIRPMPPPRKAPPRPASAANAIDDPPTPAAPPSPEQMARLEAESACRVGLERLREGDNAGAEAEFRIAVQAMPSVPEYQLYWKWSSAQKNQDFDKRALEELEKLAATTARQDSRHAFPPYVSAYIAMYRGDDETALRFFKVADHRAPDNKDAGHQVRRLTRKGVGRKKKR